MVECFERVIGWASFQGSRETSSWLNPEEHYFSDEETFFMTIEGEGRKEGVHFGYDDYLGDLYGVSLSMPSSLFARCVFRLNETRERVNITGHGHFEMDGDSNSLAIYTTACNEKYRFSLEDLVILAELI